MKLPSDKDLDWLRRSLNDPDVAINVVINGYVDEITAWLPGLLKERDQARAEADKFKGVLEFYAYEKNWEMDRDGSFNVMDYGEWAREALQPDAHSSIQNACNSAESGEKDTAVSDQAESNGEGECI